MHTCTCRAIYTRKYFYIHTYAHARGYGCSQTQMGPPMRVCVRIRASVHAWRHKRRYRRTLHRWAYDIRARACAHAHAPMESTRTLIHLHVLIHTYVDGLGARECRFRRAHARAHTHVCLLGIYTHTHMHIHALTHTHTHMVTHI